MIATNKRGGCIRVGGRDLIEGVEVRMVNINKIKNARLVIT